MAKTQGLQLRPKLISIAVASCFVATTALANPTGPTVVHGTAAIQGLGTNLVKVTNSPSAIINWQSFSIGANEITRFIQQSRSSAVLNRVTGTAAGIDPSVILGALKSNGRVFLINPSGILFGAGAQVDVAGLVASSLDISNADFLANRLKFTGGAGAGSVNNQGDIQSRRKGNVYLVGSSVTNSGVITSPQGEVVLAAGRTVELVDAGTPDLRVLITAPDNQAINLGSIIAESGRVGIYAGLINNSGTVSASSAVAEGGKILLKATKEITLESTSILDASGAGGGTIEVLAKNGGTVNVNGRLDASAPVSGDGGFIETSADTVKVADGTVVRTGAPKGKAGLYLIDPNDLNISAYGGDISGATIESMLTGPYGGNVTLTSDQGAYGGSGNINVNDIIDWTSGNDLTMLARNAVIVNQSITNGGDGDINLYGGWNGSLVGAPEVTVGVGSVQVGAAISTLGNVRLIAGDHAHQINGYGGSITADGLRIDSLGTSANFADATNFVNTLSGRAKQGFVFRNGQTLTVGSVAGRSGITVIAASGQASVVDILVEDSFASANLNVNAGIKATGAAGYGGSINLDATGFYGGSVGITNSTVEAIGGSSGSLNGGSGTISINARDDVSISGSTVRGRGADGGQFGGFASVNANAQNGTLSVTGGSTVEALGGAAGPGFSGGGASVVLISNSLSTVNITGSTVRAIAGAGDFGGSGQIEIYDGGGNVNITNSNLRADGAEGGIIINAANNVSISGSTLSANGFSGQSGNNGGIEIDAGNNLTVANSTLTSVAGSGAAYGGGDGWIETFSNNNTTITNSTFSAAGGSSTGSNGGSGHVDIHSNGTGNSSLTVTGSTLRHTAGAGSSAAMRGSADVRLWANSGGVLVESSTITSDGRFAMTGIDAATNIVANNSTVTATGRTGLNGGDGFAGFNAGGTINSGSSTFGATGRTSLDGGEGSGVLVSANGNVTLGLVTSNEFVAVNSFNGSIIDGNAGANVSAPTTFLSGANGVGSIANPLETATGSLFVSAAYGGEIGVLNAGNLASLSLMNGGAGANLVGTTGTMVVGNPISVSGDLTLAANNGMVIENSTSLLLGDGEVIAALAPGISAGGDLVLNSGAGDMGFNGVTVTGNNVTLSGNNILVGFTTSTGPTEVRATNLMKVTTAGNLNILGGAHSGANALLAGTDVDLTVGTVAGFVNINGGENGATAQIHAGSPQTITLHFPTLGAGGYFINGVENVIADGSTGFFANGSPAVLGESLKITYGGAALPPPVQQGLDQVVSSTNDQDKEPETNNTQTELAGDGKEKKELPVCK